MNTFAIVEEVKQSLNAAGVLNVYDAIVTPDQISCAESPYACIGELRKTEGRVMGETEQKCYIDVFIWTKYKGKKLACQYGDAFEAAVAGMARDFFVDEAFYDYDEESGWSLAQITLRSYLE